MTFRLSRRTDAAGTTLSVHDTLGSTSTEAMERAAAGEGGPLWVVARRQTAGTGRRGAAWETPRGNLAASLLLTLDLPPAIIAQLGFVAGLALARALHAVSSPSAGEETASPFRLKWPNDVLAGGEKLAGILLQTEALPPAHPGESRDPGATSSLGSGLRRGERRSRAVVIGIGVNVASAPANLPYPAASLRDLGFDTMAEGLFEALSETWLDAAATWDRGRGFEAIREGWLARAAGLGGDVAVRVGEATTRGTFETIDEHGQLVVRTRDGSARRISAGEVHFGRAATARSEATV